MDCVLRCPHEVIITCDSAAKDFSAAVWQAKTGFQVTAYKHATALASHSLQLLRDSYIIGASATQPTLFLWPLNEKVPVLDLKLSTPGKVTTLACSSNGAYLAASVREKIYVWQTCNGSLLATIVKHYKPVTCLIFNKDGGLLASGGEDGMVFAWPLAQIINHKDPKELSAFSYHSMPVKDLYFGFLGTFNKLCSVSLDKSARIYDPFENKLLFTLIFDVSLTTVIMDGLENDIYVGSSTGAIIKRNLCNLPQASVKHVFVDQDEKGGVSVFKGHVGGITALGMSVDNITLLSGATDANVCLWDILTRNILLIIKHKAPIVTAFFSTFYDNFKTPNLKPHLSVKPLAKTSSPVQKDLDVAVFRRNDNQSWLIPIETKDCSPKSDTTIDHYKRKLEEALREVKRLKKLNTVLYECNKENVSSSDGLFPGPSTL